MNLSEILAVVPLVDVRSTAGSAVHLLCSDPADPQVETRQSLVLEWKWLGVAHVVAEIEGAQRFLVPPCVAEAADPPVRVLTAGGTLGTFQSDGVSIRSDIVPASQGPEHYGMLTCCLTTHDIFYVGGMGRQLYGFDLAAPAWRRLDEGLVDETFSPTAAIYGLAQSANGELLAVGGDGEIWRGHAGRWRKQESGTNVMLNAAQHIGEGQHLVCGAAGTLLQVTADDTARMIEHAAQDAFLFEMATYGRFHQVLSLEGIHLLQRSDLAYVQLVEGTQGIRLLRHVGEHLWGFGSEKVGRTLDGLHWEWVEADRIELE